MNMIIAGEECKDCIHGVVDEESKKVIKTYCRLRDKTYYYGQCIACEDKEKKKK